MAKYDGTVLVVGASGGVGRRVVQILLKNGIKTRVLVRDSTKGAIFEKLGATVFFGDVTAPGLEKLKQAMDGATAVISALGSRQFLSRSAGLKQVDYLGTRRLVNAAKEAKIQHFILVSTMGVYERRTLAKPFSLVFYPKWQAEEALVTSGLTYTIVRPGGLVDSTDGLKGNTRNPVVAFAELSGEGGFNVLGRVHREDVADIMVKSLWTASAKNRIFDVLDKSSLRSKQQSLVVSDVFA
jgi:uncharacterized protein YbjT (DUF2867 family)